MKDQKVTVVARDLGGGASSSCDKFVQQVSSARKSENLGVALLEDLDSYWDDINDRLTISRMVSDSVIKGMVKAVEQVAEEQITAKELELTSLKEILHFHPSDANKSDSIGSSLGYREAREVGNGLYYSFSEAFTEHDKMRESLGSLRSVTAGEIEKLKKEIDGIRGCSSMRRISSGSELLGLCEIVQEKASQSLMGVDKRVGSLKMTVDTMCVQMDDMVKLTKASLSEWQQEQEFGREIEAMVMQSSIRSLCEEFEERLWDQNVRLCGSQSVDWLGRIDEVSNLRKELDVILKSLSNLETGQLISHGSRDMDHFHRKALRNHVSPSSSLWEGNGISEESKNGMPENWEAAQLKHMTKDELVNYFNNMITEMRRNHESDMQKMTEEYFSLKREYLKEKGSSLLLRKDKDLDAVRKKIPVVILKLDDILVENEKLSTLSDNSETLGSLKGRLDSLLLENRQLRDSLSDKRKEVKCLTSQVSDAAEKMLQHSLAETNLLKLVGNLKSDVEDAEFEASITEDIYKCFLREVIPQINCDTEELEMQSIVMKDIYGILYREAARDTDVTNKCEIGDLDIESLVMQGLCGVIFEEAIKDAQSQFSNLNTKYLDEKENRVALELKLMEIEEGFRFMIEEKERLEQQVHLLVASLEEKEKLELELSTALVKEKEQFQLASQEINDLKDHSSYLQTLISERSKDLDSMKGELTELLEQIKIYKTEINKLNQKLEVMSKELREADVGRNMLLGVIREKQNDILLLEAKQNEQRKKMQAVIGLVHGLSRALSDLESQVAEGIKNNNLRLEESRSQLSSLTRETIIVKKTSLLYKRKLDRRCNDLQLAEAEVDLLGDEVDALSSLLEKIYIALNHYSPILRHYTGITEILKLIKIELSGESTKAMRSA
ncbi:WPP domain-associated protein-like [Actinidia eriantha]|uniref:WPP domain-associated protein-like n=1 Tax=Actinidia eriantha TaxID=165200 RepID=UPI00258C5F12|nr:WPP domain-associated protein-like [Actinidia eriantha]XP_057466180.1 WPP domain-associated protein-like [Actinidia eriantha]